MMFLRKYKLILAGISVGGAAGYLYYHFAGCAGGACLITSKPVNSTLYGALLAGLFFSMFQKEKSKTNEHEHRKDH